MNDRRQGDRRVPPAVAQHAIEERAELLARIEEQAREIERLSAGGAKEYWRGRCMDAEMAMKSQPSGVALPEPFEMRPFQTIDRGSVNYMAGFNAALRKVRERLNSPNGSAGDGMCNADSPADRCICREEFGHRVCVKAGSAGVVDERAAFEAWMHTYDMPPILDGEIFNNQNYPDAYCFGEFVYDDHSTQRCWAAWQANTRLNPCRAQAVPEGYVVVPVDPTPEMLDRYPFNVSAATSEPMDKEDLRVVYQAMLAAAPSAQQKESDDE